MADFDASDPKCQAGVEAARALLREKAREAGDAARKAGRAEFKDTVYEMAAKELDALLPKPPTLLEAAEALLNTNDRLELETVRRRANGYKKALNGTGPSMLCDDVIRLLEKIEQERAALREALAREDGE